MIDFELHACMRADKDKIKSLEQTVAELTAELNLWKEGQAYTLLCKAELEKSIAELRAERERLVTALGFADDWISKTPHGDNCHLHDTGEFAQCFCGKTNVRDELALASPPAAEEPK